MSQPCAITTCKRMSRALCYCCQQNLCLQHVNEHNAFLVSQLNPLTDEVNTLSDRLNAVNIQTMIGDCRQKLEQWRLDCYQKIDQLFEQKCQEFNRLITMKLDTQRKKTIDIQSRVAELLREQEATQDDIDSLMSNIRDLTRELDVIEQTCLRINTRPLVINGDLIQIKGAIEKELDLSCLPPIYKTISRSVSRCKVVATNGRFLLMQQETKLCLIDKEMTIAKQSPCFHDKIFDMCWSSVLARFIMTAANGIYLMDENTMSIETLPMIDKRSWFSCTCSDTFLFLSTFASEPPVVKFNLSPLIVAVKEWKSPDTCGRGERIDNIVYSNGTLALMIGKPSEKSMRMELRSSDTFDRIWMLPLDIVCHESISNRCCSLNCNEWLLADFNARRLMQVTKDGKIKKKIPYNTIPYRISLFGPNILAVSAENGVNFHKILCED